MTIKSLLGAPREREWKDVFQGVTRWSHQEAQSIYDALFPYALTNMQQRGYRSISKDTPTGLMHENFVDIRERSSLLFSGETLLDSSIHDRKTVRTDRAFCIKSGADPSDRIEIETAIGKGGQARARRRLDRKHEGLVRKIFKHVGAHPGELVIADMCDIQRYIFRVGFYVSKDGTKIYTPKRDDKPKNCNFVALTICLDQGDVPTVGDNGWRIIGQMDREAEIETYEKFDPYESSNCPVTDTRASGLQIEAAKRSVVELMRMVTPSYLWDLRTKATCSKLGRARQIRLGALADEAPRLRLVA